MWCKDSYVIYKSVNSVNSVNSVHSVNSAGYMSATGGVYNSVICSPAESITFNYMVALVVALHGHYLQTYKRSGILHQSYTHPTSLTTSQNIRAVGWV